MKSIDEQDLDDTITNELKQRDQTVTAPDFTATWQAAQRTSNTHSPIQRWQISAVAATTLLAVSVWVGWQLQDSEHHPDVIAQTTKMPLLASLTRTKLWQAPSDKILDGTTELQAWGVPALNWQAPLSTIKVNEGEVDETK